MDSLILRGEFEERLYRVEAGGPDLVGRYDREGGDLFLTNCRSATIEEDDRVRFTEGKTAVREPGRFHRFSCVGSGHGMTLVETGRPEARHSLVARFRGDGIDVDVGQPIETEAAAMVLEDLIGVDPARLGVLGT